MKIKIVKAHPWAKLPVYATPGAACFDLYARSVPFFNHQQHMYDSLLFDTGLKFEIPTGHAMMIYSRSGHGFIDGLRLSNCVGVIDSDYRGTVQIRLHADRKTGLLMLQGMARDEGLMRVAQAMVVPVSQAEFQEVDSLSDTIRGDNGFGSTGNSEPAERQS